MSEITVNQAEVAKLKCEPGEVLLITIKGPITSETAVLCRNAFTKAFEDGGGYVPTILVVDDTITAQIIKADQLPGSGGKG